MEENLIAFLLNGILGTLGLEGFRTLGETKEARDKRQDLGLEDFRTFSHRWYCYQRDGRKQRANDENTFRCLYSKTLALLFGLLYLQKATLRDCLFCRCLVSLTNLGH